MRRWLAAAVCCLPLVPPGGATCTAQPLQIHDDRGRVLQLQTPAARIIAIAPHLTELAFAAGAGSRLIAVSEYSDYPAAALRLPRVGDGARVDMERILALKPDLVLAWKSGNQAGDIARLERHGIAVYVSEPARLTDIARLLRGVALLAGVASDGERAASAFERELDGLRNRYGSSGPGDQGVRVFYEIWHQPLLTVNGAHMISDAIALCGGVNVFANLPVLTPAVTLEAVLAARPQVVLGGGSSGSAGNLQRRWQGLPVAALRALPAYDIPPDSIQRQSPRIVEGIRAICTHLERHRSSKK